MTLIIILVCLAIQRWLGWDKYKRKSHWFERYHEWFYAQVGHRSFWFGIGGVCLLVLPIVILYVVLATLFYFIFTVIGYHLLSLVILWYAMDSRPIARYFPGSAELPMAETRQAFVHVYQNTFAFLFWFVVLGATGVIIYLSLIHI